jgi:hypothetical protein
VEQVGQLCDGVVVFGGARHSQHVKNCSHVKRGPLIVQVWSVDHFASFEM